MAETERRLAAVMLADIAGYSALMERDETRTFERMRSLRDQLTGPKVTEYGGRVIKTTGDGFLAEFPSATAALKCGIAIQRLNHAEQLHGPAPQRFHLRIGINLGDIIMDGPDISGDGVNVAARLEPLAPLDGICISAAIRDQIREDLGVVFEDLGDQKVKNLARPIRAYRIGLANSAAAHIVGSRRARFKLLVETIKRFRDPIVSIAGIGAVLSGLAGYWNFHQTVNGAALGNEISAHASSGNAASRSNVDLRMTFAVLPFQAPKGDAEAERLAQYATDTTQTKQEARHIWARVTPRPIVEQATAKESGIRQLGDALGVHFLLRGVVSHENSGYKVDLAVIDAETEQVLDSRDLKVEPTAPPILKSEVIDFVSYLKFIKTVK